MLKQKVALITGASKGIGRAIALKMAQNGADIALNYFSNENNALEVRELILKTGVRCEIYRCDVSDCAAVKQMTEDIIRDFSHIDILVNNAGITKDGLIAMMSENDFDIVIKNNLKSAFNTIKSVYPYFMKARAGSIINIASIAGLMGNAGQANYSAAKAGMIALTKSVAREYGGRGITCNAIAPGFIESDMTAKLSEEVKKNYIASIPLRRAGSAENVADLAVFLASKNAAYITGEVIKVDGGLYI